MVDIQVPQPLEPLEMREPFIGQLIATPYDHFFEAGDLAHVRQVVVSDLLAADLQCAHACLCRKLAQGVVGRADVHPPCVRAPHLDVNKKARVNDGLKILIPECASQPIGRPGPSSRRELPPGWLPDQVAVWNLDRAVDKLPIVMHKPAKLLKRRHGLTLLSRLLDDPAQPQGDDEHEHQQPAKADSLPAAFWLVVWVHARDHRLQAILEQWAAEFEQSARS